MPGVFTMGKNLSNWWDFDSFLLPWRAVYFLVVGQFELTIICKRFLL